MTDSTPREQGVVEGWMLAITYLEEYGGAAGRALAKDMRTRFPELRPQLFVVTQGQAYEYECPTGIFDSLALAQGQFPIDTDWIKLETLDTWQSNGFNRNTWETAAIYQLKLNEALEES